MRGELAGPRLTAGYLANLRNPLPDKGLQLAQRLGAAAARAGAIVAQPVYGRRTISTRRFCERPAGVSLLAMGAVSPRPAT